jgi:hypothetical protein
MPIGPNSELIKFWMVLWWIFALHQRVRKEQGTAVEISYPLDAVTTMPFVAKSSPSNVK